MIRIQHNERAVMAKECRTRRDHNSRLCQGPGLWTFICGVVVVGALAGPARVQLPTSRFGEAVPRTMREMYDRGLQFLAKTQSENGDWPGGGGENGPGTTGMAMMVFLACGEDPNFGPYSNHIRLAIRNMIRAQDTSTGILGPSMYHHGFATLALAEAYGVVDERGLWPDGKGPRTIGQVLELAVRAAVTSQKKNPLARGVTRRTCAMPTPR